MKDEATLVSAIGRASTLGVTLGITLAVSIALAGAYGIELVATSTAELATDVPRGLIALTNVRRTFDATVILDRGGLLSGNEWYLVELRRARSENVEALTRLRAELTDPGSVRLMQELDRAIVRHREELDALLASDVDRSQFDVFFQQASQARRGVSTLLDDIEGQQLAQLEEMRRDAVARVRRAGGLLVLVSVGGLTLAIFGGSLLARAIVQSGHQLAHEVAARRQAEEEARAAIGERDRLLSVASHELRNPIQTINLGLAHLCRRTADRDPCPSETLARLTRTVERAGRLLDALLEGARLNVGRLVLEREEVDLAQIVRDVTRREQEAASDRRATVELALDAPGPLVGFWDPLRLDQVVCNLVANAIKYGQGRPVDITLEATADVARLIVRDRGPGIEPADQARVFEPFQRASHEAPGFGLGLWIARGIVEAHGGTIRLESAPGQGATFVVELPRAAP